MALCSLTDYGSSSGTEERGVEGAITESLQAMREFSGEDVRGMTGFVAALLFTILFQFPIPHFLAVSHFSSGVEHRSACKKFFTVYQMNSSMSVC